MRILTEHHYPEVQRFLLGRPLPGGAVARNRDRTDATWPSNRGNCMLEIREPSPGDCNAGNVLCSLSRLAYLAVLSGILCACTWPQRYQNFSHPNYSAAEYIADLAQCRSGSSTVVVSVRGYDLQSGVGVDEAQVNACMEAQGWRPASASVSGIAPL